MITDADIKKMKKVFATKDDVKSLMIRMDGLDKRMDRLEERIEYLQKDVIKSFESVLEMIGKLMNKLDDHAKETSGHTIRLGIHEERLQKVEHKVFPQA